jgi:hypothetical protein
MVIAAYRLSRSARFVLAAAMLPILAACASSSSPSGHALSGHAPSEPPPPPTVKADTSYDWHGLVLAPFGTLLKDSPIALHEVLLFHDAAPGSGDVENRDCHAIDGAPPRFVGRQPDQYLLCFDHDRLNRIEASVRLPADDASPVFARACALWLKSMTPPAVTGNACEGRDGGIAFSARLALVPDEAVATVSMTLSDAAAHEAAGRPAVNEPLPDAPP